MGYVWLLTFLIKKKKRKINICTICRSYYILTKFLNSFLKYIGIFTTNNKQLFIPSSFLIRHFFRVKFFKQVSLPRFFTHIKNTLLKSISKIYTQTRMIYACIKCAAAVVVIRFKTTIFIYLYIIYPAPRNIGRPLRFGRVKKEKPTTQFIALRYSFRMSFRVSCTVLFRPK